jgi:hypothetical protein
LIWATEVLTQVPPVVTVTDDWLSTRFKEFLWLGLHLSRLLMELSRRAN